MHPIIQARIDDFHRQAAHDRMVRAAIQANRAGKRHNRSFARKLADPVVTRVLAMLGTRGSAVPKAQGPPVRRRWA